MGLERPARGWRKPGLQNRRRRERGTLSSCLLACWEFDRTGECTHPNGGVSLSGALELLRSLRASFAASAASRRASAVWRKTDARAFSTDLTPDWTGCRAGLCGSERTFDAGLSNSVAGVFTGTVMVCTTVFSISALSDATFMVTSRVGFEGGAGDAEPFPACVGTAATSRSVATKVIKP